MNILIEKYWPAKDWPAFAVNKWEWIEKYKQKEDKSVMYLERTIDICVK